MELKSIKISNYRSIEEVSFSVEPLDDNSFTYGLIGVNEAGKSSFLKALAFLDDHTGIKPEIADFPKKEKVIAVAYDYELSDGEVEECNQIIIEQTPDVEVVNEELKRITLSVTFDYPGLVKRRALTCPQVKSAHKDVIESVLLDYVYKNSLFTIFWKSEDKYLINKEISLAAFASDPDNVSIPLKNCFALLGLDTKEKIQDKIREITDSTERQVLRDNLGAKVTELINEVWPNHKITITFDISGDLINLHVNDPEGKPKTTNQRSDGFKQFVSFLLNVSSQKDMSELSDSIILLDEPETHLHPQAQEYFLSELIKITQGDNNVCFFATHSNYMIDKSDLSRNFRATKGLDGKTSIKRFDKNVATYASVNYEVFDVVTVDYFNQLYGILHEKYQDEDSTDIKRESIKYFDQNFLYQKLQSKKIKKDRPWKGNANEITFITDIRNKINHYNSKSVPIDDADIRRGVEYMKELL